MILSDGTTSITVSNSFGNPDIGIEQSTAQSAGGRLKTQIAGNRYKVEEIMRLTGSELLAIINLLKGSGDLFYTPTETPPEYTGLSFPIKVVVENFTKTQKAYNGQIVYHCKMDITSAEYI